jgi:hypothetical protein
MLGASGVCALCPAVLRSVNACSGERSAKRATHPLVRIPVWLTLAVAALVIIFGSYRLYLASRPTSDETAQKPRRGLYSMGKRTHLFVGIIYLLLGAGLIATSFGWNPFGSSVGPSTETPAKDKAPTRSGVPTDQLPKK